MGSLFVPEGHFYSPLVDAAEAAAARERIWPARPDIAGIDFDDASHREILERAFPAYIGGYDYAERGEANAQLARFFTRNDQFSWLDARALFVMLRHLRPRRVVEVGAGHTSLLMADVNQRFFDGAIDITCVEPHPPAFLQKAVRGIGRVVPKKVQEVPLDLFATLEARDILFIDSSHVAKAGSDVNHLYFEVLPRLRPGVVIHVHDIFLPHDYPQVWVIGERRNWNEQYLLRALLMYSTAFRVIFGSSYAFWRFPELVKSALALPSGKAFGGGSFWMERA